MSTTIDNKVVEMQFDNSNFERNVKTSIDSLNNLNKSLKLEDAAKGLQNVETASNNCKLTGLDGSVSKVMANFSALQVMAVTALANITNSAVNAGKKLVAAFTIEPIKTGFQEYELKMGSVQTIMASTGATLEEVNGYLDELNEYSDRTIYSFSDMTNNIGKFTNAGVKLEDAVLAIKGISNEAAISGANANEASRAMYNFAQALSAGYVKLIDWKSIENANMATVQFKQQLIDSAVAAGTLTKTTDGMYRTLGGTVISATKNFNDSLQDQWMTTEVLVGTLKDYADETTDIGEKAYAAAQDVKTFSMMMDTLKESAQSGWAQTWELLVGDFEESKALWTELSELFGNMINDASEARNSLLEGALNSNWEKMTSQIEDAGLSVEDFEAAVINSAKAHGIRIDDLIKQYGSLSKVFESGAISVDSLGFAFDDLTSSAVDLPEPFDRIINRVDKMSDAELANLNYTEDQIKTIRELQSRAEELGIPLKDLVTNMRDLAKQADETGAPLNELINNMEAPSGRELLIDTLRNSINAVVKVMSTLKEAWQEVFPAFTSENLYNIIEAIHDFSEKLILSDESAAKLKTTFVGIFSIFDIVVGFVKDLAGGLVSLAGNFSDLDFNILDVTSSIGEWLINLKNTVNETDVFGTAIDKFVGFIQRAIDKFKEFVALLKDKIEVPSFDTILGILQAVWDTIQKIIDKIKEIATSIGEQLGNPFKDVEFGTVFDVVNGGLLASLLIGLKSFVNDSSGLLSGLKTSSIGLLEKISGIATGVKSVLDTAQQCLSAWQENIKANVLLKIAGSIAILAASLVILSMIDPEKLNNSLGTVTVLLGELMGSMAIFNRISGDIGSMTKASTAMVALSLSVLILSAALKNLSSLSWDELGRGLAGVMVLVSTMTIAMTYISKNSGKAIKGALQMILFAVAVKILAGVCADLSSLSWEELAKGLSGLVIMMAVLTECMKQLSGTKGLMSAGIGMVIFAAAVKILASAVTTFSTMSWEEIAKGLSGLVIVMYSMMACMKQLSGSSGLISAGIGMVIFAAGIKIVASAVMDLGTMSWEGIAKGLIALVGALTAITIAINCLPKDTVLIGVGLVVVAASIKILASALMSMGGMSWEEVAKGLVALAGSMAILAIGLNCMNGTLAGSAALIVASVALAILAPVLISLGNMSWEQIGKGLLVIAGAFAVIGVAGLLLAPVVPAILGLALAFMMLGVASLAIGVSLGLIAIGLTAVATAGATAATALMAAITIIIAGIISLIPTIIQGLGAAIILLCQVIIAAIPAIGQAIIVFVTEIVNVLVTCGPMIIDCVLSLLSSLLVSLVEYAPTIIQSVIDIIVLLISAISENIGTIIDVVIGFIVNLIEAIAAKIPDIIQAAVDLVLAFINGLANGIRDNAPLVKEAFLNLFSALLEAVCTFLGIHSPSTVFLDIGVNLVQGLINGIVSLVSSVVTTISNLVTSIVSAISSRVSEFVTKGIELITNLINGIAEMQETVKTKMAEVITGVISKIVEKYNEFKDKGKVLITWLINGIGMKINDIKNKAKEVIDGAKEAISNKISEFTEMGKNLILGLVDGIKSVAQDVIDAVCSVASDAIQAAKDLLGIASPSKVFTRFGEFCDMGLINGFRNMASQVNQASVKMGSEAIDGMEYAMQKVSDIASSSVDYTPKITPVLDMTSMGTGTYQLGADVSALVVKPMESLSTLINQAQADINASNNEVINAINGLREDFSTLMESDGAEVALYVDSKQLASSIAKPMNRQLNILAKRGPY